MLFGYKVRAIYNLLLLTLSCVFIESFHGSLSRTLSCVFISSHSRLEVQDIQDLED